MNGPLRIKRKNENEIEKMDVLTLKRNVFVGNLLGRLLKTFAPWNEKFLRPALGITTFFLNPLNKRYKQMIRK